MVNAGNGSGDVRTCNGFNLNPPDFTVDRPVKEDHVVVILARGRVASMPTSYY